MAPPRIRFFAEDPAPEKDSPLFPAEIASAMAETVATTDWPAVAKTDTSPVTAKLPPRISAVAAAAWPTRSTRCHLRVSLKSSIDRSKPFAPPLAVAAINL